MSKNNNRPNKPEQAVGVDINSVVNTAVEAQEVAADTVTPAVETRSIFGSINGSSSVVTEKKPEPKPAPIIKEKNPLAPKVAPDSDIVISEFKPGDKVAIKRNAKRSATGSEFPPYAYKHVYIVRKITEDRIIIQCESLKFAVKHGSLEMVKPR